MASSCLPLTFVKLAVVADSRLIGKQAQCWQIARVSAQFPLASKACAALFNGQKRRPRVGLALNDSDFSPLSVKELEENALSGAFPEPDLASFESGSNSLELESAPLEESEASSDSASQFQPPSLTKLYVGNLPWDCDNQQLEELFKEHGSVFVAEVVLDKATGRSRGFGFVYMNSPQDAEVVIEKLNGKEAMGRTLRVNYQETAEAKSGRANKAGSWGVSNVNKVFVGNLPWSMTDEDLQSIFSRFGTVVQARIVTERETGRSRGFGFVSFSSSEEVEKALIEANGLVHEGRFLRVTLAEGKPPAARSFY